MQPPRKAAPRGRPPTITRERIADAGIEIGLPGMTFTAVAGALGVSQMALYKHVANLEALKILVAEEIFSRWQIPQGGGEGKDLQAYLLLFAESIRGFVKAHPGLTPYVIRRLTATQPMIDKIIGHQRHIACTYGISEEQSRWLLATVAFHCFAVADTVYSTANLDLIDDADHAAQEAELEAELVQGMHALIVGALAMLERGLAGAEKE